MHKAAKWLLRSLAFVFLLLVFLLGAIAIVLNTGAGSRFALNRVAAATDGALSFDGVDGTLWRNLQLDTLRYGNVDFEVLVTGVELSIDWPGLASGVITLNRVTADEVLYRKLSAPEPEPAPLDIAMPPLPFAIDVDALEVGAFVMPREQGEFRMSDISASDASLLGSRIRADSATVTFAETVFALADADVELSGPVPVEAAVSWQRADGTYAGEGVVRGTLTEAVVLHTLQTPNVVRTEGVVRLQGRIEPQFDLRTGWDRFVIAGAELSDGDVSVRGTTGDYQTDVQVTVNEPRIPQATAVGSASGNLQGFTAANFRISSSAGIATVDGDFTWLPDLNANLAVQLEDFDPSRVSTELTGLLDATFDLAFTSVTDWQVSGLNARGTLNGADIAADGTVTMTSELVRCEGCEVLLGDNRLTADGTYGGDRVALKIDIDAPDLNAAWSEIGGELFVEGRLDGELRTPRFAGTATGSALRFRDWAADSVTVESRGSGTERIDLTLAVQSLHMGDTDLGSLEGAIAGTLENIDVDVQWNAFKLEITAAGNVTRTAERITALLNRATVTEEYTGRWVLAAPVTIRQQDGLLTVDAHRWLLPDGVVEVESVQVGNDETVVKASLAALPLSIANAFLPEIYRLSGTVDADIDVTRSAGEWLGTLHWSHTGTVLRLAQPGEPVFDLNIPLLDVDATLADGGAVLQTALRIDPGVSANLDVDLDSLGRDATVDARLRVEGEEWNWVSTFVPAIDDFGGTISANLAASGPLAAPALSGEAAWRDGSIVVPYLNVPFTAINLVASGEASGVAAVRGSARAGDGTLEFNGRIEDILQSSRRLEIDITGNAAEIVNWPEYRVWASPKAKLQASTSGIEVSGDVTVPKAEIVIRERAENAVNVSSDIRVVDEVIEESSDRQITIATRVVLGDAVHVSAFGLDTRLEGELQVRQQADQPMSAYGRIRLVDGVFVAYGQRLTIEEGSLVFTGPLDNPIVDVRAVRTIENFDENVTAGIQLRGRANALSSNVFSDPTMNEANALSYLIIGRPLSEASSSEGGQLSGAAVGLGLRQASRITQQIGQSFGLDQLAITGDGGDATALVAGKQINDRLYARYAYGVFSRLGMVILRYRLSERVSLEAGAGENQSIDILYSVEKE